MAKELLFILIIRFAAAYSSAACPFQSKDVGGKCLTVETSSKSWTTAKEECTNKQGKLAELEGQDITTFIHHLEGLGYAQGVQWWIGAHWKNKDDGFRWITSNNKVINNWADGEPGNEDIRTDYFKTESCVELRFIGKYNDQECEQTRPFICEYDPSSIAIPEPDVPAPTVKQMIPTDPVPDYASPSSVTTTKVNDSENFNSTIIFVIVGVLFLVFIAVGVFFLYKRKQKTTEEPVTMSGVRHDSINSLYGVSLPPPAKGMGSRHVSENSLYDTHPQADMTRHDSENSLYGYATASAVTPQPQNQGQHWK